MWGLANSGPGHLRLPNSFFQNQVNDRKDNTPDLSDGPLGMSTRSPDLSDVLPGMIMRSLESSTGLPEMSAGLPKLSNPIRISASGGQAFRRTA